ncbi:Oidioi.mRNA.OKI2018_I69.chr2.g7587.t1.cds [Oikopleura dioica]|uniref:Cell cycle control protein n=1 Tax=Oikopleura dioica TaxID=34765 RepID=A0ABN7T6N0_OIKDI|nr:Oidioi.mRNA.OKI2018_I69.chr2.g7587.t1.cds [Oikopleura dioica]
MSDGVRNRNNTATSASKSSVRSKKPDNSAFKQQRLPAWQPVLTAKSVLPIFFIVGVIFIPIGSLIIVASNGVQEVEQVYTDCEAEFTFTQHPPTVGNISNVTGSGQTCKDIYDAWIESFPGAPEGNPPTCICSQEFTIEAEMESPIFAYYRLTNYYQNHRRYVKSRDDTQLLAEASTIGDKPDGDCSPYDVVDVGDIKPIPIAPCGAIANSLFNDTFFFRQCGTSGCVPLTLNDIVNPDSGFGAIPMSGEDIAWKTDKSQKFDPNEKQRTRLFLMELFDH